MNGKICVMLTAILFTASTVFGQVVIDLVLVNPPRTERGNEVSETIQIVNLGSESRDLTGWSLSSSSGEGTSSWTFPSGIQIKPDQRFTIYWHASAYPIRAIYTLYTGVDGIAPLDDDGGDLALISPEGIEHYVQWGESGQELEALAAAAGKWTEGAAVDRPGIEQGLIYDGEGVGVSDWSIAAMVDFERSTAVEAKSWGAVKREID